MTVRLRCFHTFAVAHRQGLGFVTEEKLTFKNSSLLASKALWSEGALGGEDRARRENGPLVGVTCDRKKETMEL